MALNIPTLASDIASGIGSPGPTTQITAWATGIIQTLQTATVNHSTGTVTGTAPTSGGPLTAGTANGGIISGIAGSAMASAISSADPVNYPFVTPEMISFCNGIALHIQSLGLVNFASGTITGICSNTLLSPGTLTGEGAGGLITGLSGTLMANEVVAQDPVAFPFASPELIGKCSAIANHIISFGSVTYLTGTVIGVCAPGGGPLTAGTASGGSIS